MAFFVYWGGFVANHKSSKKRARQDIVRRARNVARQTKAKTAIKAVRAAVAGKDAAQAKAALPKAQSLIAKLAKKGVINKKAAARKVGRLARQSAALA